MSARCAAPIPPILLIIGVVLSDPAPAHAYIDPGTGSYMLQLLLAGIFATLFAVRVLWKRIVAALRKNRKDERDED